MKFIFLYFIKHFNKNPKTEPIQTNLNGFSLVWFFNYNQTEPNQTEIKFIIQIG